MDLINNSKCKEKQLAAKKDNKNNAINNSFSSVNCDQLHIQESSTQQSICYNDSIYYSVASTPNVNDTYLTTISTLRVDDNNINSLLRYRPQSAHSYDRQELRPIRELQKRKLSQDINYCRYDPEKEAREQCKKYSRWLQVFIFYFFLNKKFI